ncbi:hypothetical protein RND81_05G092400 [Saponaria officinalis]|uniref:AB hydrolase-1 domain-containing protein n=1 Tax=Saponaria officinalis TaxID=3572 RepID=A0AAW1KVL5_SAPOF
MLSCTGLPFYYSLTNTETTIMAKDAIAEMHHLGCRKAQVIGHSMGGMIALMLAA